MPHVNPTGTAHADETFTGHAGKAGVAHSTIVATGHAAPRDLPLQDGPHDWYLPVTAEDFEALDIERIPQHAYDCQEPNGNLLDQIGDLDLEPSGDSLPLYQQSDDGWESLCVALSDLVNHQGFNVGAGEGPDLGAESWAAMFIGTVQSSGVSKHYFAIGDVTDDDANLSVFCATAGTDKISFRVENSSVGGVYDVEPDEMAMLVVYNRTGEISRVYTNREKLVGFHGGALADGAKGFGGIPGGSSAHPANMKIHRFYMWSGADAEFDDDSAAELFEALNIERPWVVAFDGPGRYYVPTTDAEFDFLESGRAHSAWTCQQSSGDLIGVTNAATTQFDLADAVSPGYLEAAYTDWVRRSVRLDHNSGDRFVAAAGVGPDPSATSVLWLGYIDVTVTGNNTTRPILYGGGGDDDHELRVAIVTDGSGATTLQAKCCTNTAVGTDDFKARSIFEPIGLLYNRVAGLCAVFTEQEWIPVTYDAGVTDGVKGLASNAVVTGAGMRVTWLACWSGSAAAKSKAQVRELLTTYRWSPAWSA